MHDHEQGGSHDHGHGAGHGHAAKPEAEHSSKHDAEHGGSHSHSHDRGHGHDHSHALHPEADRRWLLTALALIVGFLSVEVVVGVLAHSLALLSDSAHMLTDAASIGLALFAMRLAARPARGGYTFGLKRAEILSAQANGITLLVLSAVLAFEAVRRLLDPPPVTGGPVLATALAGIVVNIAAAWSISQANRTSLNVEGAFQHILTDLYGFLATAAAGLLVVTTGFRRADAIASLVVVALMVRAGAALVTSASRIFLEAAPAGVDPDAVGDEMAAVENVVEVHDLHIWEITSGQAALSAHVLVVPGRDCHKVRRDLQKQLHASHGITHATLQVDHLGEDKDRNDAELLQISTRVPDRQAEHCEGAHGPVHTTGAHAH